MSLVGFRVLGFVGALSEIFLQTTLSLFAISPIRHPPQHSCCNSAVSQTEDERTAGRRRPWAYPTALCAFSWNSIHLLTPSGLTAVLAGSNSSRGNQNGPGATAHGERVLEVASKSKARACGCDRNGSGMRVAEGERARGSDGPAII